MDMRVFLGTSSHFAVTVNEVNVEATFVLASSHSVSVEAGRLLFVSLYCKFI